MIKIKIFGKKDCSACESTKEKFAFFLDKWSLSNEIKMIFYDLDTLEGLTEDQIAMYQELGGVIQY